MEALIDGLYKSIDPATINESTNIIYRKEALDLLVRLLQTYSSYVYLYMGYGLSEWFTKYNNNTVKYSYPRLTLEQLKQSDRSNPYSILVNQLSELSG
jgi:hypothetical protein